MMIIENKYRVEASHDKMWKLDLKIDLNLKINEDLDKIAAHESHSRDFVTHIFRTHSTYIEFIGFKCNSGKMYYTGNPSIGRPFLLGQFHH